MLAVEVANIQTGSDVSGSFLSSQSNKPFEVESYKFFRVESSHDLVEWSQCRVRKNVESLRVSDMQAHVNVESDEISHFF